MEIKYIGHSSFFIKTKTAKCVTDPFDPKMVGLKYPKMEADVVTVSHHHADHDKTDQIEGSPLIIDWPGQFEKTGMRIWGYRTFHDDKKGAERGENVMYKLESERISLLHCGDLGSVPDDALLDEIGDIDILFVPVGGTYTIDAASAVELTKKIEPAFVIPMHYELPGGTIPGLAPVSNFLKEMGVSTVTPMDKLVLKKEDLTDIEMKVIVLNR